jgi:hypothetical protein
MVGRPATSPTGPPALRTEVLKELQALIDDREARERVERGPLAEAKGREHWILHLLLRADELGQAHVSNLVGTAYVNLLSRLQGVEESVGRIEESNRRMGEELAGRLDRFEKDFSGKVGTDVGNALTEGREKLSTAVLANLDQKWKPVSESVETFVHASHQLTKDISDTYRVATQTRLLLNENARRMIDLGRDIVALEEGLKLALSKVIEEALQPLEERVAALEGRRTAEAAGGARDPPSSPASG